VKRGRVCRCARWLVFTLGLAASGCYLSHQREDPCAEDERCAVVAWVDHPSAEVLGWYEAPGGDDFVDHDEGRRRVEAAVGRADLTAEALDNAVGDALTLAWRAPGDEPGGIGSVDRATGRVLFAGSVGTSSTISVPARWSDPSGFDATPRRAVPRGVHDFLHTLYGEVDPRVLERVLSARPVLELESERGPLVVLVLPYGASSERDEVVVIVVPAR